MKKIAAIILITAAVMTLTSVTARLEKAQLTLSWCCGQEARRTILEETIADYMATHPDVQIDVINPAGYSTVMKTWVVSGNAPDIMWYGVNWPALMDFVMPVDEMLAKTRLDQSIHPGLLKLLQWEGRTWGVPYGAGAHVMYYNKDLFDRAGLHYPGADWTWDEAISMARKLTVDSDGDGQPDQWGLNLDAEYQIHGLLYGGDFYASDKRQARFDNPVTAKAVQLYAEMKAGIERVWGGKFADGNVAMASDGAFTLEVARKYLFDWDLTNLPQLIVDDKSYRSNFMGPESWLISKTTKHPAIALEIVALLLSEEVMGKWGRSGTSIPSQPRIALKHFVSTATRGENMAAFVQALDYGYVQHQTHPIGLEIQGWMYAQQPWKDMWAAQTPASNALPELEKGVNVMLDEYWSRKGAK